MSFAKINQDNILTKIENKKGSTLKKSTCKRKCVMKDILMGVTPLNLTLTNLVWLLVITRIQLINW